MCAGVQDMDRRRAVAGVWKQLPSPRPLLGLIAEDSLSPTMVVNRLAGTVSATDTELDRC
jgi:hypothetical protein